MLLSTYNNLMWTYSEWNLRHNENALIFLTRNVPSLCSLLLSRDTPADPSREGIFWTRVVCINNTIYTLVLNKQYRYNYTPFIWMQPSCCRMYHLSYLCALVLYFCSLFLLWYNVTSHNSFVHATLGLLFYLINTITYQYNILLLPILCFPLLTLNI